MLFWSNPRFLVGSATLASRFFRSTRNLKFLSTFFVAYSKLSLRQPHLSRRGAHSIFSLRSVNRIFEISFNFFQPPLVAFQASCSSTLLGGARKLTGPPFPSSTFSKNVTHVPKIAGAMPRSADTSIARQPSKNQAWRAIAISLNARNADGEDFSKAVLRGRFPEGAQRDIAAQIHRPRARRRSRRGA